MNLTIKIKDVTFNNPIFTASGTFGSGKEFQPFIDLNALGALVTKTVTLQPRRGNPPPRIIETPSGLLNAIGLENEGVQSFIKNTCPLLKTLKTRIIVSVAATNPEELAQCIQALDQTSFPDAFEINLSCPNIDHRVGKKTLISQDAKLIKSFISAVRKQTDKLVCAKLTPNVTDIAIVAQAAEEAGADAVSLVNTYLGLAVDPYTMQPCLGNVTGGLSGPAIKPLALHAVWKVFNAVSIPIIGIGGIMKGTDVAEFMLCGASAVQVGTANFVSPGCTMLILEEFKRYLQCQQINTPSALIGNLKIDSVLNTE